MIRPAALAACIAMAACAAGPRVGAPCQAARSFGPFDARPAVATQATAPDGMPDGVQGGAPDGLPGGAPDGMPDGMPDGLPGGAPDGMPDGLIDALVAWYQDDGRADTLPGVGCPFAPTCSVYARTALRRYGPLALVMIVDRLLVREHPAASAYYPTICVGHTVRLADGVP